MQINKLLFTILLLIHNSINTNATLLKVAVFCSADDKAPDSFKALAKNLGKQLSANNLGLVTGGSKTGLMKEVIDGYLSCCSDVQKKNIYGVLPEIFKKYNVHHSGIPNEQLIWTQNIYQRLETFHKLSNVIIILPGGFGTLHELLDFLVAKQFSLMNKTIILINYENYWDNLIKLFQTMQNHNLLADSHKNLFVVVSNERECIEELKSSFQLQNEGLDNFYWQK